MCNKKLFKFFLQDGQLVASRNKRSNRNIRGDKIMWVDGKEIGVSNIKFLMNQVSVEKFPRATANSYLRTSFSTHSHSR